MEFAVHYVEIYLLRTDEGAGDGGYMPHASDGLVRHYLEIFTHGNRDYFLLKTKVSAFSPRFLSLSERTSLSVSSVAVTEMI